MNRKKLFLSALALTAFIAVSAVLTSGHGSRAVSDGDRAEPAEAGLNVSYDWLELPVVKDTDHDNVYALGMTVDGRRQRNYSFLWNESRLTADWVAYPLCRGNIGEGTRSNTFGLCPLLPAKRQPAVQKAYRKGNAGWYSRGHQIPSADRMSFKANVQTFYGVNMTPQDENLNGGVWSVLENKVRAWARRCDTLYVVSGCTYDGYKGDYVLDNDGKKVAVPTGYYKALLMRNDPLQEQRRYSGNSDENIDDLA